jgi:hypothetical protein
MLQHRTVRRVLVSSAGCSVDGYDREALDLPYERLRDTRKGTFTEAGLQ